MTRFFVCLLLAALVWPVQTNAALTARLALTIGNGAYDSVPLLPNPTRDAAGVAQALRGLGFEVVEAQDLRGSPMRETLLNFARRVAQEKPETAMIYFAGHGIELGGSNYLIPIDARLESDLMIEDEAVNLRSLLNAVAGASGLGLVVLDACRENPFSNRMRSAAGLTRSVSRGLARPQEAMAPHLMVAYAAQDGALASDGESNGHSPYARALIEALEGEPLAVDRLFGKVKERVLELTGGRQEPWKYDNFGSRVSYLHPEPPAGPPGGVSPKLAEDVILCEQAPLIGDRNTSMFRVLDFYQNPEYFRGKHLAACEAAAQAFPQNWRFYARAALMLNAVGSPRDALKHLRRAAELGGMEAAPALGHTAVMDSKLEGAAELAEIVKLLRLEDWLRQGLDDRTPLVMFYQAMFHNPFSLWDDSRGADLNLLGQTQDKEQGRLWMRRAAEAGEPQALLFMCLAYSRGWDGFQKNTEEARKLCQQGLFQSPDPAMTKIFQEAMESLDKF